MKNFYIFLAILVLLSGCGEKKEESKTAGGMKCGAGKCGANMFDGNSALAKKKNNILSQMREKDSRKDCVMNAKTTKAVYDCVREPDGRKLSLKCGTGKCGKAEPAMKCGAGKCGASMNSGNEVSTSSTAEDKSSVPKEAPAMKCGAGKCGVSMNSGNEVSTSPTAEDKSSVPKEAPAMKCGAGKCGAGKCGSSMKQPEPVKIPTH